MPTYTNPNFSITNPAIHCTYRIRPQQHACPPVELLLLPFEHGSDLVEDVAAADVDARVDECRDERLRLLGVVEHGVCGAVLGDAAKVDRLLASGLCGHHGEQRVGRPLPVERQQSVQTEVAAYVAVQHEEGVRCAGADLVAELVQSAGGAQRGVLLQVAHGHAVPGGHLGRERLQLAGRVRAQNEHLAQAGHGGARLDVVLDDGSAGHREQRLRHLQRERPKPGPCNQVQSSLPRSEKVNNRRPRVHGKVDMDMRSAIDYT